MKPIITTVCVTMFIVSAVLNIGLVSGYVRIASPDQHKEMAYADSQRALMSALVEDVQ